MHRNPFEPFRVVTSSGESHKVTNPELVVVMRSEIFIADQKSDRCTFVPFLHVSAVETLPNGRSSRKPKRRGR